MGRRSRTCSESSDASDTQYVCRVEGAKGVAYDVDGKFSYSQVWHWLISIKICLTYDIKVVKCGLVTKFQTTVDENGKFAYFKADMRPVPPGMLGPILKSL